MFSLPPTNHLANGRSHSSVVSNGFDQEMRSRADPRPEGLGVALRLGVEVGGRVGLGGERRGRAGSSGPRRRGPRSRAWTTERLDAHGAPSLVSGRPSYRGRPARCVRAGASAGVRRRGPGNHRGSGRGSLAVRALDDDARSSRDPRTASPAPGGVMASEPTETPPEPKHSVVLGFRTVHGADRAGAPGSRSSSGRTSSRSGDHSEAHQRTARPTASFTSMRTRTPRFDGPWRRERRSRRTPFVAVLTGRRSGRGGCRLRWHRCGRATRIHERRLFKKGYHRGDP